MKYKFMLRLIKFYCLFIVLLPIVFVGCDGKEWITAKEFLFQHPQITLQLNGGEPYTKYTPVNFFKSLAKENEILTINIADKPYEVLLKDEEQRIGDTDFFVKVSCN